MLLLPSPKSPGKGSAFEVLGVPQEASMEEIRRAYLWLSRRYHPDVNPDGHGEYLRINQAYAELAKRGNYARLKLKCDAVEAKAAHAEFLKLVLDIKTLTGIEIPPLSPADMSRRDDAGKAFNLGFALIFRCPACKWKKECDRATGFDRVERFHYEFISRRF